MKPSISDRFWQAWQQGRQHNDIQNAFNIAAMEGRLWRVNYLLNHKDITVDINDNDGWPLRWASYCGRLNMVDYLIKNGADIHAKDDGALIYATQQGKSDIFHLLIHNGANIHAQDEEALKSAAEFNRIDLLKYLLDKGVKNKKNVHAAYERAKAKNNTQAIQVIKNWQAQNNTLTPPAPKPPQG